MHSRARSLWAALWAQGWPWGPWAVGDLAGLSASPWPCPATGPEQGGGAGPPPVLYVNQLLISPSGICVEYHFFNYRPWAGLPAACCGANYHKSPVTINNAGAELHVFPML